MKRFIQIFNRTARALAVFLLAGVIVITWMRLGWQAAFAAAAAAAAVSALWCACLPQKNRNPFDFEELPVQLALVDQETCRIRLNGKLSELRIYAPAAAAALCRAIEDASDGRIGGDEVLETAKSIIDGRNEYVQIAKTEEIEY